MSAVDPEAVKRGQQLRDQLLDNFATVIKNALDSGHEKRFHVANSLALHAAEISTVLADKPRVADFDDSVGVEPLGYNVRGGLNIINGNGVAGGDQMELLRTLINGLQNVAVKRNGETPARELNELLEARAALLRQQLGTQGIDERIEMLRKEISNAVVSADVLRGHSLETERTGHGGVVGEADGYGARRDGEAPRDGS